MMIDDMYITRRKNQFSDLYNISVRRRIWASEMGMGGIYRSNNNHVRAVIPPTPEKSFPFSFVKFISMMDAISTYKHTRVTRASSLH